MRHNSKCYCVTRIMGRIDYVLSYIQADMKLDCNLIPHYWCRDLACSKCYFGDSENWSRCELFKKFDFASKVEDAWIKNDMFQVVIYLNLFRAYLGKIIT